MKSMRKTLLTLFLATAMVLLSFPASVLFVGAADTDTVGEVAPDITAETYDQYDTFVINNVDDWKKVADLSPWALDGRDWAGKTILLGADIGGTPEKPVQLARLTAFFRGTLDGQGHKIQYVTTEGKQFLSSDFNGEIKNLRLENIEHLLNFNDDQASSDSGNTGLIAGITTGDGNARLTNVTVKNCTARFKEGNTGKVGCYGFLLGKAAVAGGTVTVTNCIVEDCTFNGSGDRVGLAIGKLNGKAVVDGLQVLGGQMTVDNNNAAVVGTLAGGGALTAERVYVTGVTTDPESETSSILVGNYVGGSLAIKVSDSYFDLGEDSLIEVVYSAKTPGVTFTNCVFETKGATARLVRYVGETTAFTFTNCMTTATDLTVVIEGVGAVTVNGKANFANTKNIKAPVIGVVSADVLPYVFERDENGFVTDVKDQLETGYYQVARNEEKNTYALRLITLSYIAAPEKSSMTVTVRDAQGNEVKSFTTDECEGYATLIGYDADGAQLPPYEVEDFHADRFLAVVIKNIPLGTAYTYELTPSYVTGNGVTVTGETVTLRMDANGDQIIDSNGTEER